MEQLIAQYQKTLLGFFRHRAVNAWDAEELTQEVFCKILKRKGVALEEYTRPYMFTIAWSVLRDRARGERVRQRGMHIEYNEEALMQIDPVSPENELHHDELYECFLTTLNTFKPMTRAIFILSRYKGLSYTQIAKHFDVSVSTVEKHMMKALKRIKEEVKELHV